MTAYADYLMVITPPDNIVKEILRYKRASANTMGHFEGMHSSVQIVVTYQTRCNPGLAQPAFEKMIKRLHALPPVELRLNGFGFFNHGETARTIYAVVEKTAHTDNWFRLLKKQLDIRVENFVPHITLVRNIPVTSFDKLWPNFENRPFSETFTANSLTILQKETFVDYCEWRHYKELFFADKLAIF